MPPDDALAPALEYWLAAIQDRQGQRWTVRATTEGGLPGANTAFEAIPDPFADPEGDPWEVVRDAAAIPGGFRGHLDGLRVELPLRPSKILGVGRNFRAHAAELGNEVPSEPLLFFKPPSALIPSGAAVRLPRGFARIDLEGELVVVIGRRARAVAEADAWTHVAGYALGNDLSCRDLQRRDGQWTRAKGFDGFAPVSAQIHMKPPGWAPEAAAIELRSELDGRRCQTATLDAMIFAIPALIATISECMTLYPGDLIFTGTPEGVTPVHPGEVAEITAGGPLALAPVITRFV